MCFDGDDNSLRDIALALQQAYNEGLERGANICDRPMFYGVELPLYSGESIEKWSEIVAEILVTAIRKEIKR
jgi:hypothetical protein